MEDGETYPAESGLNYSDPVALPYSRYQRASLAPWLTGLILALVVFVILIVEYQNSCFSVIGKSACPNSNSLQKCF